MLYRFTLDMWPSWVALLVLIVLGTHAWRRRHEPGALPFAVGSALAALWAGGAAMAAAAVPLEAQEAWLRFSALWHLPSATAMTAFVLEYTFPGRWLSRRNLVLLLIPALLAVFLVATDPILHLMWVRLTHEGAIDMARTPYGRALIIYGLALGLVNVTALAWLYRHSSEMRWIAGLMIAFTVAARLVYAINTQSGILVIAVMACVYSIALFGFRILDPIAIALRSALAQMADGMLVMDTRGRVARMNPAAEAITGVREFVARGRPVSEILSAFDDIPNLTVAPLSCEIARGSGSDRRCYTFDHRVVTDFRALPVGYLILLHDVTEIRRAEARMVEQQRALATLREREQLARELHDSIGQVLGYAGLQTETASTLIATGRASDADALLDRLAGVLRDAHADVRQQILDLRAVPSPHEPICTFVRRYLDAYAANYGIATALTVGDGADAAVVPSDTQAHVCRILQEALANVRRHSGARRVAVAIEPLGDTMRIVVSDDGHGFDPERVKDGDANHLGLHYMRERAEQMGGSVTIHSAAGLGTTVSVTVPLNARGTPGTTGGT